MDEEWAMDEHIPSSVYPGFKPSRVPGQSRPSANRNSDVPMLNEDDEYEKAILESMR